MNRLPKSIYSAAESGLKTVYFGCVYVFYAFVGVFTTGPWGFWARIDLILYGSQNNHF